MDIPFEKNEGLSVIKKQYIFLSWFNERDTKEIVDGEVTDFISIIIFCQL